MTITSESIGAIFHKPHLYWTFWPTNSHFQMNTSGKSTVLYHWSSFSWTTLLIYWVSLLWMREHVSVSVSGETSRPFQRTRYYDNTLVALVRTGVRLLWSAHAKESAALLADLARLEQRKGHGISVPAVVRGQHREQTLQLYLSLPSVNYAHALSLCHNFSSIAQVINR